MLVCGANLDPRRNGQEPACLAGALHLALVEIPVKGRNFTRGNIHEAHLLERLDLLFFQNHEL